MGRSKDAREKESLHRPSYGELSPAWEEEIQRRLLAVEEGRGELIPGDQVFEELEAELRARAPRRPATRHAWPLVRGRLRLPG